MDLIRPAPFTDVMALFGELVRLKPALRSTTALQALASETVAILDHGQMVAVVGLLPLGEGAHEVWFAARPGFRRVLLPFVRQTRSTLAAAAQHGPVLVRALVRRDHEPGRRLARLTGFRPAGVEGDFELWEWTGQ